jgi:hypothetical protein
MRDYIIENALTSAYDIYKCLDAKISDEVRNQVLSTKVTKDNLFEVLRYSFNPLRDEIYKSNDTIERNTSRIKEIENEIIYYENETHKNIIHSRSHTFYMC